MSRFQRVKEWAVVFIGMMGTIGICTGWSTLRMIGQGSLASPVLVVYSELSGYKVMSLRPHVSLELEDGTTRGFVLDRDSYNFIAQQENPFNRHVFVLGYVAALQLLINRDDNPQLRESILKHGFCNGGPLTHYLHIGPHVRRFTVRIDGEAPDEKIVRSLTLECQG